MVSALTSEQSVAKYIEQMNKELDDLEERFLGDDHQKEIDDKLVEEQRLFDAAVDKSVKACEATKQSSKDIVDFFISSFASHDITCTNGKQIENLKQTVSELRQFNEELLSQYTRREGLLRNLIEQQAKTQKSLF